MELDAIKLLALGLGSIGSLLVLLIRKRPLILHWSTISVLMGLLLIASHYFVVGYSLSEANTDTIIFAAALWLTACLGIAAFGPQEALQTVFKALSIIIVPAVIYLLYLQVDGAGISGYGYFVGISDNPNIMGAYLALFIFPIAIQNLFNRSHHWLWLFFDSVVVISTLYLVYLTGARGAALAIAVSLAYISLASRAIGPAVKVAFVVAMLIGGLALQGFFQKYESMSLVDTRQYLFILRLEAIAERPWFGWGLAADVNNSFNGNNIFPPQEKGNTLLQFIEEFGFVVGGPMFLAIVALCFTIVRNFRNRHDMAWVVVFLLAALSHSMVETWMLNFRSFFAIAFWFLLLFAGASSVRYNEAQDVRFKPRGRQLAMEQLGSLR